MASLNSNFALTLGFLNSALNNLDQALKFLSHFYHSAEKNLQLQPSIGQVALTFCLPGATTYLSKLSISWENELPGPLSNRQVSFTCYLPSKKIYLSWITGRAFSFEPCYQNPECGRCVHDCPNTGTDKHCLNSNPIGEVQWQNRTFR